MSQARHEMNSRPIDSNVAELVQLINGLPGLETSGSCGGHDPPIEDSWRRPWSQIAPGWYVQFESTGEDGDQSLMILAAACYGFFEGEGRVYMPLRGLGPPPVLLWLKSRDPSNSIRVMQYILQGSPLAGETLADFTKEVKLTIAEKMLDDQGLPSGRLELEID